MFREIGPYRIERQIGRGMSPVFLAVDTRTGLTVALKVVPVGLDEDAREILEAEEQGADLQRRFAALSQYVPRVHDVGRASDYFYIAMDYIDGEDLSTILAKGPLAPARAVAVAIQLSRFLEEVDRVAGAEGESALTLLHNDLKPGNIRLEAGDRVKILDFGAAKVLSLSKRVTRNVFGSIPYLSPECLETGKRDRYTDSWALGVLLYEMVAGRLPFRAESTVNLERRIRSRELPEPPAEVPAGLRRVIAKLLAPYPADRYQDARAIRIDLENIGTVEAEVASTANDTWPGPTRDEPATRRTREPLADEAATRAVARSEVARPASGMTPGAPVIPTVLDTGVLDVPVVEPIRLRRKRSPFRRAVTALVVIVLVAISMNEIAIARRAGRIEAAVPMQEFADLKQSWQASQSLAERSYLGGVGVRDLEQALRRQSQVLAERVIANYRSPAPTVRESQWEAAADALRRALAVSPRDNDMRAALRYAEGHLHRIDGEAQKARNQQTQAQRELAEAVTAFREATELRPDWPDPFLGLARTFIYGLEDIDRGADAIAEAQKLGYATGARETAQLGDGYRARGETIQRAAEALDGLPQQRESLTRAAEAYKRALELYSSVADYADVATRIRITQSRLAVVERRLGEASLSSALGGDAAEAANWAARWLSQVLAPSSEER